MAAGSLHAQPDTTRRDSTAVRDSLRADSLRADSLRADSILAVSYLGPTAPVRSLRPCQVTRVVDGDTLVCSGLGRVRLIGIDSPERDQLPYGEQARAGLLELVPMGSTVSLEPDLEPRDQYDRLLAYVWREGEMVNWLLVRRGWAVVSTYLPNVQYTNQLLEAQRIARQRRDGLWETGGFDCLPADRRAGRC